MDSTIVVATIGAIAAVISTFLANRGRQHAKAARTQVENNHSTNLREEGDERHAQNTTTLEAIQSDIRGIRRDVGRLTDRSHKHEDRIDEIDERTRPPLKQRKSL